MLLKSRIRGKLSDFEIYVFDEARGNWFINLLKFPTRWDMYVAILSDTDKVQQKGNFHVEYGWFEWSVYLLQELL